MDSGGSAGIDRPMLAYWFLFLVFAAGALRYITVATGATAGGPPGRQREQIQAGHNVLTAAALIPAVMIGLRYNVGSDFNVYSAMFNEISRRGLDWGIHRIDPAYGALNWLAHLTGAGFWLVNLICGLVFMFGLVRFAKQQPLPWLAITVAVPYLIIVVGMGYSRQAVAIGLSMAGLVAVANRSFIRFVLWVFAGALFHRTAVILIPIVAIAYSRNRLQAITVAVLGCIVGYFALGGGDALQHFRSGYIDTSRASEGAGIRLAMNLPPALIFLGFARRFSRDPIELRLWLIFSVLAVISFGVWMTTSATTAVDRMALYVIPLQMFVFSRLPVAFPGRGRPSGFATLAVILYSALVQFTWLVFAYNARSWIPYQLYPMS